MRVAMMQYYTPYGTNAPCGIVNSDSNSSEVEDYTINLVGATLSVTDLEVSNFSIYPNPTKSAVTIKMPSSGNYNSLKITMYDIQGRVVKTQTVNDAQTEINFSNLNALTNGVYILKITEGTKLLASKKLIKI